VRASRTDVQYLLDSVNARFPRAALTFDDVVSAWAGIRPLVASWGGGDPARASREHEISVGPRGIVTVTGGKLTTYRAVGEQVVDLVAKSLGRATSQSATRSRALPGAGGHAAAIPSATAPLVAGLPYTLDDVERAATLEFACTIADVLMRRTKVAFETRDHGWSVAPVVGSSLARLLGWSDARLLAQIEEYRSEVARLFSIDD
jgi:glycerol-3-phosphate dehydrogenase